MPISNRRREYLRKYRIDNPEKVREWSRNAARAWRDRNPDHAALYRRKYNLKKNYLISVEQYDAILQSQNGLCGICLEQDLDRRLCVDHDHGTGIVRGLLCRKCNTAIGQLKDKIENLERAILYLRKSLEKK